jgi:hypothetical protein
MSIEDRQALSVFLNQLENVLESLANLTGFTIDSQVSLELDERWQNVPAAFNGLKVTTSSLIPLNAQRARIIPTEFQSLVELAWIETQPNFALARESLQIDIAESEMDPLLDQAGLTGDSLNLKLSSFYNMPNVFEFVDLRDLETEAMVGRRLRRYFTPPWRPYTGPQRFALHFKSWIKLLLKWADILLESLTSVIPFLEPVIEIKKWFEVQLDMP